MGFINKLVCACFTNPLPWLAMKVEQRKHNRIFGRVFRLRDLARDNVEFAIRLSGSDVGKEGVDKYHDMIVDTVADRVINSEWLDKTLSKNWEQDLLRDSSDDLTPLLSEYGSNRSEVEQLVNKVRFNPKVKKWLTMYLRIQYYILSFMTALDIVVSKRETNYCAKRLENLDGKTEPIIIGDIESLISEAQRDLKSSQSSLSDRKALKIPLSLEKLGSIVSLLPVLLLISGFTYTYVLYGFFGVPISLYFSVSDYISSSIERIYTVFLVAFFYLALLFFGFHRISRRSVVNVQSKLKTPNYIGAFIRKWINSIYFKIVIWLLFSVFIYVVFTEHERTHLIIPLIIFSGGIFIPHLAVHFFNKPVHAVFVLFLALILVSYTYSIAIKKADDILEGEKSVPKLCRQVNIEFNDGIKIPCGSPIIGATESHIFIFNQDDTTAVIFPRSHLKQSVFDSPLYEGGITNQFFRLLSDWRSGRETQDQQREIRNLDNIKQLKGNENQD